MVKPLSGEDLPKRTLSSASPSLKARDIFYTEVIFRIIFHNFGIIVGFRVGKVQRSVSSLSSDKVYRVVENVCSLYPSSMDRQCDNI